MNKQQNFCTAWVSKEFINHNAKLQRGLLFTSVVSLLALALPLADASAQQAVVESLMERSRPDYDPLGFELFGDATDQEGAVVVYPRLELGYGFDNNVFRTKSDTQSDSYYQIHPSLRFDNQGEVHNVSVTLDATFLRNFEFSSNDYDDYGVSVSSNYLITEDLKSKIEGGYRRTHEARSDPNSVAGRSQKLTRFEQWTAGLGLTYDFDRYFISPRTEFRYFDYLNSNGVNNAARDYYSTDFAVRAGLELDIGMSIFAEPNYEIIKYVHLPGGTSDRSGNSYGINGGIIYDVTSVTYLTAIAGYFNRSYDDSSFTDTSGLSAEARLVWNPTDLLTVRGQIGRSLSEATQNSVSSIENTTVGIGADYEMLEDLLLNSNMLYTLADYEGSSRTDNTYNFSAGFIYLLNGLTSGQLRYSYENRDSSSGLNEYSASQIEALISLQY